MIEYIQPNLQKQKMKKISIKLGIVFLVIIAFLTSLYFYIIYLDGRPSSDGSETKVNLSQNDVAALAKPAIVYVTVHVKGKAVLPSFKMDFAKLDIVSNPTGTKPEVPFDEYLYGSGFIINKDGYILTNSHVISYQTIKIEIARQYAMQVFLSELEKEISSGNKNLKNISPENADEIGNQLAEKMVDYVVSQGQFEIDKKIVVLNPSSTKEKLVELFNDGIPVRIISVNDDFSKNDKDVALLKIDETDLPFLRIGDSDSLSVGSSVKVIGFPASADFNKKNIMEATLSPGSLTSLKDSQNKDFKIFQTDAKISQGSSGSPMLNESGEVLGIITYQADDLQRSQGDNFAFALPINVPFGDTGLNPSPSRRSKDLLKWLHDTTILSHRSAHEI